MLPYILPNAQAVVLNDKVYVGPSDRLTPPSGSFDVGGDSFVYIYDISGNSWDKIQCFTSQHALTAYINQLVLVGGICDSSHALTNELWVLQEEWTQPLPPMKTKRCNASAVGIGSCLVVAGGQEPGRFSFLPPHVFDTVEI